MGGLAAGADPASLALGDERRPLTSLWDGLECFAAHDATPEPAPLAAAAAAALGIAPDAAGLVDHGRIGDDVGAQPRLGVDRGAAARGAEQLTPGVFAGSDPGRRERREP